MNKYEKSIELLNKGVGSEIATVLQYIYFHSHCEDKGYTFLSKLFKNTAIAEMKHIGELSERILFLEGDIIMHPSFEVKQVTDVKKMLELSMALERRTIEEYNHWAKECATIEDSTSHHLLEDLVGDEEGHFDNFRVEFDNMAKYGDHYLALQSIERSKETASKIIE